MKWFALLFCLAWIAVDSSAQNISLVGSNKPPQSGFGDVWGDGDIACMGVWLSAGYANGFGCGIFNISNPAHPVLLTTYNYTAGVQNRFEQGVVRSNILYLGSWGGNGNGSGLHILSLTNPASPQLLSRITKISAGTITNGFDDVHTLFLERNFLYEAAHNPGIVSVKVFDVSNPALPVYLRDIITTNTTKVHQMTVGLKGTNTVLYTSGWGGDSDGNPNSFGQTDIWDVSNVGTQAAQWLGRIFSGYSSHSSWPTPDGNTLVICRETPGGEVSLYDITTPPNPSPNSITNPAPIAVISPARMGIESDIPHNPVVIGNLLFLSWYQNGLQIFDISDRRKPVRVGAYDTYSSSASSSYQGNWGIYPKLGLNKLLVSDINNGFFILDASAILTATNNYPPLLVTEPESTVADYGSNVILSAEVTGSSIQYQWRFNGTVLAGATNRSLVFNNVNATNSGNYFVIAGNSLGSVTSAVASLSVVVPAGSAPSITAQPTNVSVYAESAATFSVAVTGAAPLNFQWRFNGANLGGETNASLTLAGALPELVGNYSVVVSNNYGVVTSSNAFLSIIDSPFLNTILAAPGGRSALISWHSTVASDSLVQYSAADSVVARPSSEAAQAASFSSSSYIDRKMTTNHTILLTGLSPATRYSFQVISSTDSNTYPSGVYQFVTAGAPIILDNTNSGVTFSGTWNSSVNVAGYYGTNYLYAVSAVSANDIWAVGATGSGAESTTLTEHWNGSAWSVVP
ncbi:MAG: immunoglobulin domain-containing protein, partial [Verrucomicrobiota bacterium]